MTVAKKKPQMRTPITGGKPRSPAVFIYDLSTDTDEKLDSETAMRRLRDGKRLTKYTTLDMIVSSVGREIEILSVLNQRLEELVNRLTSKYVLPDNGKASGGGSTSAGVLDTLQENVWHISNGHMAIAVHIDHLFDLL